MTQFLVIYRGDASDMPEPTPEQAEQMMAAWNGWAERAGDAIVDFGNPTRPASEGADPTIGGYSILQAEDYAALQGLLQGHPHEVMGGELEVFEITPIEG